MRCPICGQNDFYIKNPEDDYECYDFSLQSGEVCFDEAVATEDLPEITEGTEAFCNRCSWHDKIKTIQKT